MAKLFVLIYENFFSVVLVVLLLVLFFYYFDKQNTNKDKPKEYTKKEIDEKNLYLTRFEIIGNNIDYIISLVVILIILLLIL
jgi:hypothetical protein